MTIRINYNLVIGNALLTIKKSTITEDEIYKYWEIVDILLPDNYYTYRDKTSFEAFCEYYSFLIKRIDDSITINCDINRLKRYFRVGIPTEIASVFDAAGKKLREMEIKESSDINYDQPNIADVNRKVLVKDLLK